MDAKPQDAALNIRWLDPAAVRAAWDAASVRLTVTIGAEPPLADARALLAFPIKRPDGFVQLSDDKGEGGGMLETLTGLAPDTLTAIREALNLRYLIPRVSRVLDLSERSQSVLRWRVTTNRGERVYFTESVRESIRRLGADWLRVTDLADNQFDIPSIAGLDPASRERLANYL